jgi:uncharacterized membrane protein YgcG
MRTAVMLATVALLSVVPIAAAPAVAADPVSSAEAKLRTADLYVDPSLTGVVKIDQSKLGSLPDGVKIAVLPTSAGSATALAGTIGDAINPAAKVVGVFTADPNHFAFGAGSSAYCRGWAGEKADAALQSNRAQIIKTHDVTELLRDFAASVANGPARDTSACGSAVAGGAPASNKSSGGGSVWPWILGIAVLGAGGIAGLLWYRRRRTKRELDLARSKVMPYFDRLAGEVNTIDPKNDDVAVKAMADASERYAAAGLQLDTADSVEKYAQARQTTLEGLYAARTARKALGLDEGPPLPPASDPHGDQLSEPQEVTVQGKTFQGYPSYTPGSPYYYGGGYGVPGGWYATPFWETLLLASVLSGGFGGWGGGGYGQGYDSGYQSGYDAGQDSADNTDSGSSGGDWGGGGGDWGGGGGDWGGGGGDFGGGGDSGGSW